MRVPTPDPTDPVLGWNLAQAHDNFQAVFIGFTDKPGSDPIALIRLPLNGHSPDCIQIRSASDNLATIAGKAGVDAAPGLTIDAGPLGALLKAAHALQREQQRLATINTRLESLARLETSWKDVAIPDASLQQILQLVERFAAGQPLLPKGMLLWGPPGTGKTLIARKLAQHVNCTFKAVTIADLKGEHIGHTGPKVKKIWDECRNNAPTILFVDECESAFARRGGRDSDAFGNELVQTFIAEWDGFNQGGGNVLVIGATNRRELLDDAVMSRFTTAIELPAPDADARERILTAEFAQAQLGYPAEQQLVRETAGMSGRDLATLVTSVVSSHPGAARPMRTSLPQ